MTRNEKRGMACWPNNFSDLRDSNDIEEEEESVDGDSVDTARSDDTRRMARRAPQGKAIEAFQKLFGVVVHRLVPRARSSSGGDQPSSPPNGQAALVKL